jgi:uncharacterized membrane protein YeaQ/YmgE (transglycosylase-associated protein family)
MHFIWTCIIGLVAGAIAKLLVPGKDPGGWIITALLGIAGSFVGEWIERLLHLHVPSFILSVLGAMILLGVYHLVRRKAA